MPSASSDDVAIQNDFFVDVFSTPLLCIHRALGDGGYGLAVNYLRCGEDFDSMTDAGDWLDCLKRVTKSS